MHKLDGLITFKQLADKLGVDKARINYQATKLDGDLIDRIDGVKYLSTKAQKLITEAIIELDGSINTELDTKPAEELDSSIQAKLDAQRDIIASKDDKIDMLQEQLKTKDRQIDQLHTIIATQAQQLETKLLEKQDEIERHTSDRRSWWQRLINKR